MDKNRSILQTILKIVLVILFVLFLISTTALIYFMFFYTQSAAVPVFMKSLSTSMTSDFGYMYYTVLPGALIFLVAMLFLILSPNKETIDQVKSQSKVANKVKMKNSPFQDVVINGVHEVKKTSDTDDIVTQTLKSKPPAFLDKEVINTYEMPTKLWSKDDFEIKHFSPAYIDFDSASSISELKKAIASKKMPKVCICDQGDFSNLSKSDKQKIEKMNLLDTKEILQNLKETSDKICNKFDKPKKSPEHTYKVVSKKEAELNNNLSSKKDNANSNPETKKYLSADEIIELYRKNAQDEVKSLDENVDTSFDDLARLYYDNNIDEYKP